MHRRVNVLVSLKFQSYDCHFVALRTRTSGQKCAGQKFTAPAFGTRLSPKPSILHYDKALNLNQKKKYTIFTLKVDFAKRRQTNKCVTFIWRYTCVLGSKIENFETLQFFTEARKKSKRSHVKNRSA